MGCHSYRCSYLRPLLAGLLTLLICLPLLTVEAQAQTTFKAKSSLMGLATRNTSGLRVSFTYGPKYPGCGQPVQFTDTSTGDLRFWKWDFGDGVTSTYRNPSHSFTTPGFKKITLVVTTATGSRTSSRTVLVLGDVAASFVFSPSTPGPGQTVQFADTTPGEPTSWQWDFGDGSAGTVKNPSHAYLKAGSYTVTLVANSATASKRTSKTLTVATASVLSSSFSYSPTLPQAGQAVQFTDTSTGSPTSWQWQFGDGATSTAQNASHTYAAAGTKTVTLRVLSGLRSNTATRSIVIGSAQAAAFTHNPVSPVAGQVVQFTDASTNSPSAWLWNFGDGSTSTLQNPSHAFSNAGSFTVTLVSSNSSRSDSFSESLFIESTDTSVRTYWVSPSGTATWTRARSQSPLSGAACSSLATANANAAAGDTVYLRAGTYAQSLNPAHSGTSGSPLVFQAYAGEAPTFTVNEAGGRWAVKLQGRQYVKVDGIKSTNSGAFFFIGYGSCFNEITNCTFDRSSADYQLGYITDWSSSRSGKAVTRDNWLHHNTFSRYGSIDYAAGQDLGTIRISANYDDTTSHNTFEDNVFFYGGHDCVDIGGSFNVFRNNVFHNEDAYYRDVTRSLGNVPSSGYFGNRNILLSNSGQNPGTAQHTLIEGNRIGYAGTPPDDDGSSGIENAGVHTLIRYNDIYGNGGQGYFGKMQPEGGQNTSLKSGSWARVYNNTIYHGGYGDARMYGDQFKSGVCIWSYTTYNDWPTDVVVKNNIVFDNYQEWRVGSANILPQVTYTNNYNSNPGFANPDMSDKMSLVLPDLRLLPGSGCIDAAAPLTQANGVGSSSTTLVVDDAWLFQDGTWGSSLTHGVTHFPDWIAIGTVANAVKITAVDYAAKTITLATPMTWADNAPIWLYSDSSGRRVLNGAAPDIGAHERD